MSLCKMVELFYALIPWKPWQGWLIHLHIEKCPRCQASLASREAVGPLLVQERGVETGRPLWPEIESALQEVSGRERSKGRDIYTPVRRRLGWAVAGAFLLVLIAGIFLIKDFRPKRDATEALVPARFELEYVLVGGQPADTVVYQPQGSGMIIVWAGKSP